MPSRIFQSHCEAPESILVLGVDPEVEVLRNVEGPQARIITFESRGTHRSALGHYAKAALKHKVEAGEVDEGMLSRQSRELFADLAFQACWRTQVDFMRSLASREAGGGFDDLETAQGVGDHAHTLVAGSEGLETTREVIGAFGGVSTRPNELPDETHAERGALLGDEPSRCCQRCDATRIPDQSVDVPGHLGSARNGQGKLSELPRLPMISESKGRPVMGLDHAAMPRAPVVEAFGAFTPGQKPFDVDGNFVAGRGLGERDQVVNHSGRTSRADRCAASTTRRLEELRRLACVGVAVLQSAIWRLSPV